MSELISETQLLTQHEHIPTVNLLNLHTSGKSLHLLKSKILLFVNYSITKILEFALYRPLRGLFSPLRHVMLCCEEFSDTRAHSMEQN